MSVLVRVLQDRFDNEERFLEQLRGWLADMSPESVVCPARPDDEFDYVGVIGDDEIRRLCCLILDIEYQLDRVDADDEWDEEEEALVGTIEDLYSYLDAAMAKLFPAWAEPYRNGEVEFAIYQDWQVKVIPIEQLEETPPKSQG